MLGTSSSMTEVGPGLCSRGNVLLTPALSGGSWVIAKRRAKKRPLLTTGGRTPLQPSLKAGVPVHRFDHYLVFILLSLGGGLLIGLINMPGEWYDSLVKPWFTPPNWLFGPAWTILYVLIGTAGARTFEQSRTSPAMIAWIAQLVLNFAWSPAFFGLQLPALGLAIIIVLLLSILAFIGLSWRRDLISSALFIPYGLWVGYATALNAAIVSMN